MFCCVLFSFFPREISELHGSIAAKFCTMLASVFDFIMLIQNFGHPPPKNFRGQKHAKFGAILTDFKLWQQISLKWIKIFKNGLEHFVPRFLPCR